MTLDPRSRLNLEKGRVLLLDEPKGATDILGQVFFGFGVRQPERCTTSEAAVDAVMRREFDLIVCDGDLPGGRAYDFVSWLRRSDLEPNRYCPIVVITAHTPDAFISKARDCGANFVVAKPLRPLVLLERILWVAQDARPFVELDSYVGPDRRFHHMGPPPGAEGRRKGDQDTDVGEAATPNMCQQEIDGLMAPAKVKL